MLRGMTMHISPDPETGNGGVTRCPVDGCHQLMLVRDAQNHHDWHVQQHDWEQGVDRALDGAATGLELVPFPSFPDTAPAPEPEAPSL